VKLTIIFFLLIVSSLCSLADGTKQVSLHIPDEMAPPGGMFQVKLLVTEPTPITTGHIIVGVDSSAVCGVQLFSNSGDVSGVARLNGNDLQVTYNESAGNSGTDYPIMTIALRVSPDAIPGQSSQFTLAADSSWLLAGYGVAGMKPITPATLTVAGSVSITDVVPGGGVLPAGTVVSVRGIGFQAGTQLQVSSMKISNPVIVSSTEIRFTVLETAQMTGKKLEVANPDGSKDTYFSYMRGVNVGSSAHSMLAQAIPIFANGYYSQAVYSGLSTGSPAAYTALAIQNGSLGLAHIAVELHQANGDMLGQSSFSLSSGSRLTEEVSELVQGSQPLPGSYVVISSDIPVQTLGFQCDEGAQSIVPISPVATQP
jgi:hypothetical protein